MSVSRFVLVFACGFACIATPVVAHAATQPSAPEATSASGETPELRRERLNQEQAEAARKQLEQNAANQQAYDAAVKAREAEIARLQAQAASQQAETARVQAEYDAAMKKWQEDVAACKKGDKKRCAPPAKKN